MTVEQLSDRQAIQEGQYYLNGAYHRRAFRYPFHPFMLRYDLALRMLPASLDGLNCLDYGGGDGVMATLMADRGAQVTVFDLSDLALSYARKADPRLQTVQGITYLRFPNESFDLATMLETLEHIPDYEEMPALTEVRRVLTGDGIFVMSVPSAKREVSKKHYRHYSADKLTNKLTEAGFLVTKLLSYRDPMLWWKSMTGLSGRVARGSVLGIDWIIRSTINQSLLTNCPPEQADAFFILAKKG